MSKWFFGDSSIELKKNFRITFFNFIIIFVIPITVRQTICVFHNSSLDIRKEVLLASLLKEQAYNVNRVSTCKFITEKQIKEDMFCVFFCVLISLPFHCSKQ